MGGNTQANTIHLPPSRPTADLQGQRRAVYQNARTNRNPNTGCAYNGKEDEFVQFMEYQYKNEPQPTRQIVTSDKAYEFLWYQAYREQRLQKHSGSSGDGTNAEYDDETIDVGPRPCKKRCIVFDVADFEAVKSKYKNNPSDPQKGIGHQQIVQYRCSVHNVLNGQHAEHMNDQTWELIYNQHCKEICDMVKKRKTRI